MVSEYFLQNRSDKNIYSAHNKTYSGIGCTPVHLTYHLFNSQASKVYTSGEVKLHSMITENMQQFDMFRLRYRATIRLKVSFD
jgi:hypothetical protein